MKRSAQCAPHSTRPAKTGRRLTDSESIRQQARPFLLATAKMPVKVLRAEWVDGSNRPLDQQHVATLSSALARGIERTCYGNYLIVECSSEAVRRMREHSEGQGATQDLEELMEDRVLSFLDWDKVNGEERPELTAGQHRKAALERLGLEEEEMWWTCEIYDRGEKAACHHRRPCE